MRFPATRFIVLIGLAVIALAAWPSNAAAQRRGPVRSRIIVVGGYYGYPRFVYYDPWFDPWYQWGPYGPYGPYRPYPYGYGYRDELTASIRLEVMPRETEVYVDGYRAGQVDDYDGFFQRLRLRPGEHELVLFLGGYRTIRQQIYLNSGSDRKIRYTMVPLAPGETAEPRPAPPPEPQESERPIAPLPRPRGVPPPGPQGPPPGPRVPQGPPREMPGPQDPRFGAVSVRVLPADAEVLIDGERWSGPATQDRLIVQLSEGRHHIDVQKDGFEKYSGDVQIRRGETITLNISLLRRESPTPAAANEG